MPTFLANFFANPALVGGAMAGAIPIAIHLLNRQRFKKHIWAAMHWLWASYKKSQRRLQIEQLILLLIRILVLVLLALALAHPVLQQGIGLLTGRSSIHRVIVLDNSFSMGQRVGGHPMFDKAKELATELSKLSLSDEVDVILANGNSDDLIASSTLHKQDIGNNIKGAQLSDGATDIPKSIAAACRIFNDRKSSNLRREIIVITDQTRAAWEHPDHQPRRALGADEESVAKAFADAKARPIIRVIRLAGEKESDNLAATGLEVDEKVVPARVDTQFVATVQSFAAQPQKDVRVRLKVDGEEVSSETVPLIAQGKPETVNFRYSFPEPGSHAVSVELPEDMLPGDNNAFLAVDVEDQMRVLCVDGQQRVGPNASELDYFRQALSPAKSEEVHAGKMPLMPEVIGDSSLAEANLDNYRLVVMGNVASVPPEKVQALEQFVRRGGALWIFVGEKVIPSIYNKEMGELLPMDLGDLIGSDAKENNPGEALSDKEVGHPAIAKFKGIRGLKLGSLRVQRHYKLLPKTQADPTVRTVLAFESGEPCAVEKTLGEGRVMLFSTSASMAWNTWPQKNEYLPLMNYIALDLIQPAYLQRNRMVGEKFSMQLPRQDLGPARHEGVRLLDPAGESSAMEVLTEQSRIESVPIRRAGIHTADLPGETRHVVHFAANRSAEESDLTSMEDREVLAYFPRTGETGAERASYFKNLITQDDVEFAADDPHAVEESLKKAGGSREIWRWLATTVLCLLVAESLLARRFGDFTR